MLFIELKGISIKIRPFSNYLRAALHKKYNLRDKEGNLKKDPYPSGSYAESKQKWLAEERKKFNVDKIGRYKGGG